LIAYFDESPDTVYGIVDRASFEARLHEHFLDGAKLEADPAWYALRNAIYAYGCRIELSKNGHHRSFAESRGQAWQYFTNALSVHTDLIYTRTDLSAIQALLIMVLLLVALPDLPSAEIVSQAFFVDGIGAPALEYMLLSVAMRLAQSRGLHLRAPTAWNLHESEAQNQSWLFWGIYVFDKHVAYRSGRPSVSTAVEPSLNPAHTP
jgi:hypothetical protein